MSNLMSITTADGSIRIFHLDKLNTITPSTSYSDGTVDIIIGYEGWANRKSNITKDELLRIRKRLELL